MALAKVRVVSPSVSTSVPCWLIRLYSVWNCEGEVVTRVGFRAAENKFSANVPAREYHRIRAARERFDLRHARTAEVLDRHRELARVVTERHRYQVIDWRELNLHFFEHRPLANALVILRRVGGF
jgi:uncharacterized damage-inducible protein DinB